MTETAKLDRNFDFSKLPNFASNCIHYCLYPLTLQETFENCTTLSCHISLSNGWMNFEKENQFNNMVVACVCQEESD